jgi:nitrite reductase (NADH) small subunit
VTLVEQITWTDVCGEAELLPDRGACALVGGHQIALFRVAAVNEVFAVSNRDPFSGVNVLSRGIVGSKGEVLKVASPIYKQSFDLRTGECLDDPSVSVRSFPVRVVDGRVLVGVT